MNDPRSSIAFAFDKYPERVDAVPIDKLVMDSARGNDKRPAYVKLAVPDELVKALRGSPDQRKDLVFLVSIPREVQERSESSIILPGEV